MSKFRPKTFSNEVPSVSTASLPDIIFMLLFFFMSVTSMKQVTYMVNIKVPEATELQSLEKKSLVKFIYVGQPLKQFQNTRGTETQIQLDDAFADVSLIESYIVEQRASMPENDQSKLTVSLKIDKETKMGIVTDIKQALRRAYALKINYAAVPRNNVY